MSRTSEASKSANKRVDRLTQKQLIIRYIIEHKSADNMQISKGLNMQYSSVTARLDELMYDEQKVRIIGTNDNGRSIYTIRMDYSPLNTRPKTKAEITQDKLTAVMEGVGLTESDVNAFHRNWIEAQIVKSVDTVKKEAFHSVFKDVQLEKDAEQFSIYFLEKVNAINFESKEVFEKRKANCGKEVKNIVDKIIPKCTNCDHGDDIIICYDCVRMNKYERRQSDVK